MYIGRAAVALSGFNRNYLSAGNVFNSGTTPKEYGVYLSKHKKKSSKKRSK